MTPRHVPAVTIPAVDLTDGALVVRVPGRPVSWKRPLDRARGGRRTDPAVAAWQTVLRAEVDHELRVAGEFTRPVWPDDEPLAVEVVSCYPRPARQRTPLPKHADVDNLAKLVLDALQGLAYGNDVQVVSLLTVKGYTDGPGFVEVVLRNVEPVDLERDPTETIALTVRGGPA